MKEDYTSAATMPVKLFHNPVIQDGKIVPYHVTLIPTNKCNADCDECFCHKRDKRKELDYAEIRPIVDELYSLGTRAISMSGGGEPDCHPQINRIINYISQKGIDVAIVSNGKNLNKVEDEYLNMLQWIRISGTSSRPVDLEKLYQDMKRAPDADWGMSYVLGNEQAPYKNLEKAITFTNKYKLTHLRIVSDMMHPDENRLADAKKHFGRTNDKIIWQERTSNEKGIKKCLVNLLHPIIDADGNIQPCCGIHFATDPPAYDFGEQTAIGHWTKLSHMIKNQTPFDGKDCKICQYGDYNRALEMILNIPKHRRFV